MAYMLVTQSMGDTPPVAAIRFVLAVWTAALAVAAICAEATWRNRARLENITGRPSV